MGDAGIPEVKIAPEQSTGSKYVEPSGDLERQRRSEKSRPASPVLDPYLVRARLRSFNAGISLLMRANRLHGMDLMIWKIPRIGLIAENGPLPSSFLRTPLFRLSPPLLSLLL